MLTAAVATTMPPAHAQATAAPLATVPRVDLDRYLGRWHELARYENWFQRSCAGDVSADYSRNAEGGVAVINSCRRADGSLDRSEGVARIVDPATNAKLEVTFLPSWLRWTGIGWGNYWVIDLDPEYRYAVVGEPTREYLWVLSRSPSLDAATWARIEERVKASGYDLDKLKRTPVTAR
jgi:apolipoprotein D and lipocalin family protein